MTTQRNFRPPLMTLPRSSWNQKKRSICKEKCASREEVVFEGSSGFSYSCSCVGCIQCDSHIFTLTAEKDETPQCIEIKFED